MKAYAPRFIYHDRRLVEGKALLVEGARIGDVCDLAAVPAPARAVDLDGILAPGYVDLQINGAGGVVFNEDISLSSITTIRDIAWKHGTTSLLPTLITAPDNDISTALTVIGRAVRDVSGVIGMHLEGPYISVERRGTHPKDLVRPLDDAGLQRICEAARAGVLKLLTVAPESVTNEQIAAIAATGLCIALGHTGASADDIRVAEGSGARMLTHLFNGMPPMAGRDPGPVGAALASDTLMASIIADGVHVHETSVRAAFRALGDRLFLVSDASTSVEAGERPFTFGGHTCRVENGAVRNEEGGLAGAALLLDRNVAITAEILGDVGQAIFMATELPARAIGMDREIGSLMPGRSADFILLDAESLDVKAVWKAGMPVVGDTAINERAAVG